MSNFTSNCCNEVLLQVCYYIIIIDQIEEKPIRNFLLSEQSKEKIIICLTTCSFFFEKFLRSFFKILPLIEKMARSKT